MNNIIIYLTILLISIVVGMLVGMIFKQKDKYHGPNAEKQSKKIYYNIKTRKCIRFGIKPLVCPKPKTKLQKILNNLKIDLNNL
jgi:hypothetical protein